MKLGRAVGIDDGFFERGKDERAPLVATIMKGEVIEGFRFGWITVDGADVTDEIINLLTDREQFSILFLSGTIFGGTNVVDMNRLFSHLQKPVVAVVDEVPEEEKILYSLKVYGRPESLEIYKRNPKMVLLRTRRGTLYASAVGASMGEVRKAIERYQFAGKLPEPLRISHLLGREVGRWI